MQGESAQIMSKKRDLADTLPFLLARQNERRAGRLKVAAWSDRT